MGSFYKNKFASTLFFFAKAADLVRVYLDKKASRIVSAGSGETAKYLEDVANGADDFKRLPLESSEALAEIDSELRESVYLYFLTKHAIAIYEAKINYIPLQIYNELRNALDHYLRAIVLLYPEPEKNYERRVDHIGKMEGHLQRALLDVIKLTCAAIVENIEKKHKRIGEKAISLVKNGEYYKEIAQKLSDAERLLAEAKISEHSLGNGGNQSTRDKYIIALSAHVQAQELQEKNFGNLHWGFAKLLTLKTSTLLITILGGMVSGYMVRVLWAASEDWPILKYLIKFFRDFLGA